MACVSTFNKKPMKDNEIASITVATKEGHMTVVFEPTDNKLNHVLIARQFIKYANIFLKYAGVDIPEIGFVNDPVIDGVRQDVNFVIKDVCKKRQDEIDKELLTPKSVGTIIPQK